MTRHQPERRHSRVDCNAAALLRVGETTFTGVFENLSLGGACFRGTAIPPAGVVHVTLCLPSMGTIQLTGEIRHVAPGACGIRFVDVPSDSLEAISAYVGA